MSTTRSSAGRSPKHSRARRRILTVRRRLCWLAQKKIAWVSCWFPPIGKQTFDGREIWYIAQNRVGRGLPGNVHGVGIEPVARCVSTRQARVVAHGILRLPAVLDHAALLVLVDLEPDCLIVLLAIGHARHVRIVVLVVHRAGRKAHHAAAIGSCSAVLARAAPVSRPVALHRGAAGRVLQSQFIRRHAFVGVSA